MKCEYCSEGHKLCFCKSFAKQSLEVRRDFVGKNKICFNCLGSNHTVHNCKKNASCRICQKRHHSRLHLDNKGQDPEAKSAADSASPSTSTTQIVSCLSTGRVAKPRQVLLATALIKASSKTGEYQTVRALLDQGSQACFITEATVQYLNLKKIPIQGFVSGLGDNRSTRTRYMVQLIIKSRVDSNFKITLSAYVLNKITSYLPERSLNSDTFDWLNINHLCLADPEFNTPNKIDVLLGADVYSSIIQEGLMKSPSGTLIAQCTTLGWILSGAIGPEGTACANNKLKNINVMHCKVEDILRRFWEVEEMCTNKKIFTPEERKCEEFYSETTRRDSNGRYVVRLPFREEGPPGKSGNSRGIAKLRFHALEGRLRKNKELKEKYKEVINEYLQLGHMQPVKENDNNKEEAVYLPHHAVIRNDKTTTKVRVVFNASEKNSKGVSLNDTLMVGPSLQADLRHTVLRWRIHPIGLVADIIKMYRQVRVAEEDVMFQRILWRDSPDQEIQDYELVTVTFGTASAPYQAVKTLRQIAIDEGNKYPIAAEKVLNCFYMDDLMTGCNNVEEGLEIFNQMIALLGTGGFILQKWNSNSQEILKRIEKNEQNKLKEHADQNSTIDKNKDNTIDQYNELEAALECCIRQTQRETFRTEYLELQDKDYVQLKSSKLNSLCPYLDEKGIIRVRGRLEKAPLSELIKHPIVLPNSCHLTKLIVAEAHLKTLHGGPQLMTNYLRTAYWVLGVRNLVKQAVRKCVTCAKQRASIKNQIMGSLPSVRCSPARPFLHSGVDYAGPINIRTTKGRGHRSYKGYICLFVCMSTRALHLEVVSDMSTQAFLAAFRRFVSRRGHCAKIWSDNGTTFIGASRELQQLTSIQASIAEEVEANGTEWHFIPPHSPNFGGLWEAGVKSTKFHLKRVIGDATLTYEEMSTLLNQVEACLNSRPISVINVSDPGELLPLTPGHFLIGEPIISVPDAKYENTNISYLSRWQFIQRMVQSFWKRWSQEYLSNLMNRYKWSSRVPEPKIGDIVLIKEDDLPPSRWLLGRVIEKHPGDDGITRVVTLRTKTSNIKRPTSKVCILPVADQ